MTGITGPLFTSKYIRSDLLALFQHAVEEAETESKKKRLVTALCHLKDFMNASNHDPINWEDFTHDTITQAFCVKFVTFMGKYARNKTRVKFADGFSSALKNSTRSKKNKDSFFHLKFIPKLCKSKTRYFMETFGPSEINK